MISTKNYSVPFKVWTVIDHVKSKYPCHQPVGTSVCQPNVRTINTINTATETSTCYKWINLLPVYSTHITDVCLISHTLQAAIQGIWSLSSWMLSSGKMETFNGSVVLTILYYINITCTCGNGMFTLFFHCLNYKISILNFQGAYTTCSVAAT